MSSARAGGALWPLSGPGDGWDTAVAAPIVLGGRRGGRHPPRQCDRHHGPLTRSAADGDAPAVAFDREAAERQPEAGVVGHPAMVVLLAGDELLEDVGQQVLRDALARV